MEKSTRNADALVVWGLSLLLAAAFVTTGVAKLTGTEPIGLQAAAMNGFPSWIRVVVGVVEVGGAIAILVPAVAGFAASLLGLLMIPATITQLVSGQRGVFVPILMLMLLLIVAWRRNPAVVRAGVDAMRTPRPLVREGAIVGFVGASVIAVWFLLVDVVSGVGAFYTPLTLGDALLSVLRLTAPNAFVSVALYTVFHYGAFVGVGVTASMIVNFAKREPSILLCFVVLFAATEVGFYAFVSLLQYVTPLGSLAWYNVMGGNLLAAVSMGAYLLRAHPELRQEFEHAISRTA